MSASISSQTAAPAGLPPKICAPPERLHEGPSRSDHGCTGRACGFRVTRPIRRHAFDRNRTEKVDDQIVRQRATNDCGCTEKRDARTNRCKPCGVDSARSVIGRFWDIILSIGHHSGLSAPDARRWTRILGSYRTPSHVRSVSELAITALPLATLWTAAWLTVSLGPLSYFFLPEPKLGCQPAAAPF